MLSIKAFCIIICVFCNKSCDSLLFHHRNAGYNNFAHSVYREEKFPVNSAFISEAQQHFINKTLLLPLNANNYSLSYQEIVATLDYYANHKKFRNFTQFYQLSLTTYENRPIVAFQISGSPTTEKISEKSIVVVVCGTHASEWVSITACMALIRQLISHKKERRNFNWIIIPVLNPDGYEYSRTVDSTWRKNRAPTSAEKTSTDFGIDLNRNWPFRWVGDIGSLNFLANPATKAEELIGPSMRALLKQAKASSPTYSGPYALSERETRALARFVFLLRSRVFAYVTVHGINGGRYLMFPYSHSNTERIAEYARFTNILTNVSSQLQRNFPKAKQNYTVGAAAKVLYPVHGSDIDWMYGIAGITNTFAWELCNEKRPPHKKRKNSIADDTDIRAAVASVPEDPGKDAELNAQEAVKGVQLLLSALRHG